MFRTLINGNEETVYCGAFGSMNCLPVALSQTGSDMSFRILVPLAGTGCRLREERLGSWAAAGTFADFIFLLCYMSRHTNRTKQYRCCWTCWKFGCFISHYIVFQVHTWSLIHCIYVGREHLYNIWLQVHARIDRLLLDLILQAVDNSCALQSGFCPLPQFEPYRQI